MLRSWPRQAEAQEWMRSSIVVDIKEVLMFNSNERDWGAYHQGISACLDAHGEVSEVKNPYEKESKKWQSWNMGWNSVEPGGKDWIDNKVNLMEQMFMQETKREDREFFVRSIFNAGEGKR